MHYHLAPMNLLRRPLAIAALTAASVALDLRAAESIVIPGLDLTLLKVEAGTFTLGRPAGIPAGAGVEADETPETRVTLTQPFWLDATEVTVGQWRAFAEATGYRTEPEKTGAGIWVWVGPGGRYEQQPGTSWKFPGKDVVTSDHHPVVGVAWADAQAFCAWLTERERAARRLSLNEVYSLPTEAQWEYACKAGTGAVDTEKPDDVAWHLGNSGKQAHPVGEKQPNARGFHDMIGNVWELCQDCYGKFPGGSVTDFVGVPPADPAARRVYNIRGNSFSGGGVHNTSVTNRWGDIPNRDWRTTLGFRIARVAVAK
jgi:formylglycine-generating enzyme required for sulfatase activity